MHTATANQKNTVATRLIGDTNVAMAAKRPIMMAIHPIDRYAYLLPYCGCPCAYLRGHRKKPVTSTARIRVGHMATPPFRCWLPCGRLVVGGGTVGSGGVGGAANAPQPSLQPADAGAHRHQCGHDGLDLGGVAVAERGDDRPEGEHLLAGERRTVEGLSELIRRTSVEHGGDAVVEWRARQDGPKVVDGYAVQELDVLAVEHDEVVDPPTQVGVCAIARLLDLAEQCHDVVPGRGAVALARGLVAGVPLVLVGGCRRGGGDGRRGVARGLFLDDRGKAVVGHDDVSLGQQSAALSVQSSALEGVGVRIDSRVVGLDGLRDQCPCVGQLGCRLVGEGRPKGGHYAAQVGEELLGDDDAGHGGHLSYGR